MLTLDISDPKGNSVNLINAYAAQEDLMAVDSHRGSNKRDWATFQFLEVNA